MPVDGCRVIIQGFGNVGSNAARLMMEHGYKIIGIAEKDGGLYNPNGIDIHQLLEYQYRNNTTLGFRGAEAMPSEELIVIRLRHSDSGGDRERDHQPQRGEDKGAHCGGGR